MTIPLFIVDAFTDRPFVGNPAAVCLLGSPGDPDWMARVAGEMNLSETAFLHPENGDYRLRWFTPAIEVDLCGHATLASAHILWETGQLSPTQPARFQTRSGLLTAQRMGKAIALDFPASSPTPIEAPDELLDALKVEAKFVGRTKFDFFVEVEDESTLRGIQPDYPALIDVGTRGVIVTCPSTTTPFDFLSRFFAPAAGVNEDPVTGSAHCALAPFWAERFGKTELCGFQASPRGGTIHVKLNGDRVMLIGQAVTFLRGEIE